MRYFKVIDPDMEFNPIERIFSEVDIIDAYWEFWVSAMKLTKTTPEDVERCISDWIVCNWAEEVFE